MSDEYDIDEQDYDVNEYDSDNDQVDDNPIDFGAEWNNYDDDKSKVRTGAAMSIFANNDLSTVIGGNSLIARIQNNLYQSIKTPRDVVNQKLLKFKEDFPNDFTPAISNSVNQSLEKIGNIKYINHTAFIFAHLVFDTKLKIDRVKLQDVTTRIVVNKSVMITDILRYALIIQRLNT